MITRSRLLLKNQVQTDVDKTTKEQYWQLRSENAYALKGQAEPDFCRSMIWLSRIQNESC
ncbi:hypothetical protein CIT292_07591 [Citrobacter youngae ATCC 29220]|uniref:Uncharacterized protein n=1 Tax=Citrobacter youngae ATCC 29220 TaxID=500640 RepID=D4BAU5_9ENTR|nr:hypothetical protein CIT292_07591 [Citrobacter youngae ATCC 29220]